MVYLFDLWQVKVILGLELSDLPQVTVPLPQDPLRVCLLILCPDCQSKNRKRKVKQHDPPQIVCLKIGNKEKQDDPPMIVSLKLDTDKTT